MNYHIVLASVVGALLGSLADWLFAGVVFHGRYQIYPEVWREGTGERTRIAAAQSLSLITSFAFVLLANALHETSFREASKLAAMIWLVAPLPLLLTNGMFIKIDPWVTASHSLGWLAKLLLIAVATSMFL